MAETIIERTVERTVVDLRAPDDRAKILEFMDNSDHSPFYSRGELMRSLDLDSTDPGDSTYFNEFLDIMATQNEIMSGGQTPQESFVLSSRYRPLEVGHQI